MEWYLWLLIGYGTLVALNVLWVFVKKGSYGFFTNILLFIIAFIVGLVITPILCLIAFARFCLYNTPSYKTYTIHELTEDNKTTLRELGFQEGDFVSNNNIAYSGFRYKKGKIYVGYNGRIGVKYVRFTSKEQDFLYKVIKELPEDKSVKQESKPFELKENTHVVFKKSDEEKYLTKKQVEDMGHLLYKIDTGRVKDGKELNYYYVINKDEPYADKVLEVIKNGEVSK